MVTPSHEKVSDWTMCSRDVGSHVHFRPKWFSLSTPHWTVRSRIQRLDQVTRTIDHARVVLRSDIRNQEQGPTTPNQATTCAIAEYPERKQQPIGSKDFFNFRRLTCVH